MMRFLFIARFLKIIVSILAKFCNYYEKTDYKPILINTSFTFKKQNSFILLSQPKTF